MDIQHLIFFLDDLFSVFWRFLAENQISVGCMYYESISVFKKPDISSKIRSKFDGIVLVLLPKCALMRIKKYSSLPPDFSNIKNKANTIYCGSFKIKKLQIHWEYHHPGKTTDIIIFFTISQQFFRFKNLWFVGGICNIEWAFCLSIIDILHQ